MSLTTKELVDIVESVTGKRTAILSVPAFAQVTGRDRNEVWRECLDGTIKATQPRGANSTWRIPVTELAPYFQEAA